MSAHARLLSPELRPLPTETVGATTLGLIALEAAEGTEADPAAVLLHLLAAVGAAVGPDVHANWSKRRTPARLFCLIVGSTGSGKGNAEGIALPLVQGGGDRWAEEGIATGLASGEGLVRALSGEHQSEQDEDEGAVVAGKNLLVVEPEFARVLAAGRREGSTLTHILRDLWDRDFASVMTKSKPMRVKGAHLAVVGHVTPRELTRAVDENEIENGLLNRFLPVCVQRGELRPFGPDRGEDDGEAIRAVTAAIDHGRTLGRVDLDHDARALWAALYRNYGAERPGLHGSLVARGIAHIQRLALIFAIGDRATSVQAKHLLAAEAVWLKADAAWRKLYGERLGDPLAERLLEAIREAPAGLSKTGIKGATGSGNTATSKINAALDLLASGGLVERRTVPSAGRPAEVWTASGNGRDGHEARPNDHSDHLDHGQGSKGAGEGR